MIRVVSGIVLAAAALVAILFLPFIALRTLTSIIAGLAASEYMHITGGARSVVARALVLSVVVFTCWWAAVPAPLSVVILSLFIVAWLAVEVLREGRTFEHAAVDL